MRQQRVHRFFKRDAGHGAGFGPAEGARAQQVPRQRDVGLQVRHMLEAGAQQRQAVAHSLDALEIVIHIAEAKPVMVRAQGGNGGGQDRAAKAQAAASRNRSILATQTGRHAQQYLQRRNRALPLFYPLRVLQLHAKQHAEHENKHRHDHRPCQRRDDRARQRNHQRERQQPGERRPSGHRRQRIFIQQGRDFLVCAAQRLALAMQLLHVFRLVQESLDALRRCLAHAGAQPLVQRLLPKNADLLRQRRAIGFEQQVFPGRVVDRCSGRVGAQPVQLRDLADQEREVAGSPIGEQQQRTQVSSNQRPQGGQL